MKKQMSLEYSGTSLNFQSGAKFGHYTVRSALGAGGMGEVYLARDGDLERLVALKVLPTEFANDKDRIQRFLQEAKAASALNHPNILIVHEIGQVEGINFIATEFVEGVTLRQKMNQAPMELGEMLEVAGQVASALAAAHQKGIVHRDIKPENIMLREDGLVKVLDFGLAKIPSLPLTKVEIEATTKPFVQTNPRTVLGTVAYMSPEQARGLKIDGRSDIWSLGIVLYEMLTGQLPFAGETVSDCIAAILKTQMPPIGETEKAPIELQRIVRKALAKKREERYQTARDLAIDLKTLHYDLELQAALERSAAPNFQKNRTDANGNEQTAIINVNSNEQATAVTTPEITSNALSAAAAESKRSNVRAGLIWAALIGVITASIYFSYLSRQQPVSSIAVLPFVNDSSDSNTEFLSDGISESLINNLSQLPSVKVIARGSSFKFKGKEADPKEVANALGVQALVMGRITQSGDNVLINVELVNGHDETQIWGEQYARKTSDLLQLQSVISREIAKKLQVRLTGEQEKQLARHDNVNPRAYELLLKGNFYWYKGGTENRKKAIDFYHQAIGIDPSYAPAYAELSASYSALIGSGIDDPKEMTPKIESAARKALELDANLADAHKALADFKRTTWDWQEAEREYRRAIDLSPNYARARTGYAFYLSLMGRHEQAVSEVRRARELDPLSLGVNANTGLVLYFARRYDEAIEALKKIIELDPNYSNTYLYLGYAYAAKEMYGEAAAAYQEAIRLGDDSTSIRVFLGETYARSGERAKAQAILNQLKKSEEYVSPAEMAVLHAALGERAAAFASLEKAFAEHDLQLQYLGVDPSFDALRPDPRFQNLLLRVGLG